MKLSFLIALLCLGASVAKAETPFSFEAFDRVYSLPSEECVQYRQASDVRLYDPARQRKTKVPVIICEKNEGEADTYFLPLPDGTLLSLPALPLAAPDGKRFVIPQEPRGRKGTTFYHWPSGIAEALFLLPCQDIDWRAPDRLSAYCHHTVDYMQADIHKDPDGNWVMQGRQWVDYDPQSGRYSPETLTARLPRLIATKGPGPFNMQMSSSNSFVYSGSEKRARIEERPRLAADADIIRRKGNALVITYAGQPAVSFPSDKAPPVGRDCDAYIYQQSVRLFDPATGTADKRAVLRCHFGEFSLNFIVLSASEVLKVAADVSASPDGKIIATGRNGWINNQYGQLALSQWPSRQPIVRFEAGCTVTNWVEATRFEADCLYDPTPYDPKAAFDPVTANDSRWFRATGHKGADGLWRLSATGYRYYDITTKTRVQVNEPLEFTGTPATADAEPYLPLRPATP